jgi:hypothetical protein
MLGEPKSLNTSGGEVIHPDFFDQTTYFPLKQKNLRRKEI